MKSKTFSCLVCLVVSYLQISTLSPEKTPNKTLIISFSYISVGVLLLTYTVQVIKKKTQQTSKDTPATSKLPCSQMSAKLTIHLSFHDGGTSQARKQGQELRPQDGGCIIASRYLQLCNPKEGFKSAEGLMPKKKPFQMHLPNVSLTFLVWFSVN